MKKLKEKLEKEIRQKKKEQEARATVKKALTAFLGQVETAKADTMTEFKASQPYIDS